jgi:hypothetical protein
VAGGALRLELGAWEIRTVQLRLGRFPRRSAGQATGR